MSTIQAQFNDAVEHVKSSPPSKKIKQESQLEMYAFFKQANEGDVKGNPPSLLNPVARAKHKAWAKLKGMSSEEAMQAYIDTVKQLLGHYN